MTEIEIYRQALERIRDLTKAAPYVDEWVEAEAFNEAQDIAREALDPGAHEARVKADEAQRSARRKLVGALERGHRYFYRAHGARREGAWVRFIAGDPTNDGIAHVEVLEVIGDPKFTGLKAGMRTRIYAGNLSRRALG